MKDSTVTITVEIPRPARDIIKRQADRLGMKFKAFVARVLCEQAAKKEPRRVSAGG